VKNAFLIGPNVVLRPPEKEDVPVIVPWVNDQEVTRGTRHYRPMTVACEEKWLAQVAESETSLVLGIVPRGTGQMIGLTGLHQMDFRCRKTEFGILIGAREEWGKGYATEATRLMVEHAFQTLNFNRVMLHVYEFNERAIGIYERIGFRREGRLRQDFYRDGRYWDTLVMGLLRAEWEALRQEPPAG
jgi:RimJ/RimL family protein N-acetyltransferase